MSPTRKLTIAVMVAIPAGAYLRWALLPLRLGFLCGVQAERIQQGLPPEGLGGRIRYLAGHTVLRP